MDKIEKKAGLCRFALLIALCIVSLWGASASTFAQQNASAKVRGSVKSSNGEPIYGATVIQKGTSHGTSTDIKGEFTIELKSGEHTIEVSFIGFKSQEIAVGNKAVLDIRLEEETAAVEEVVIVAYGTQKKETLTGAITSVGTKDLLRSPNASMANTLAGQLSGVSTVQSSGRPGEEDPQIYVRGAGTLASGNSTPLILVDGVELPFFQMDPNEVESITVLKDASATAVFGVRGANGVILVTTRRGKEGGAKVSLSSSVGVTRPTRLVDMSGSYEYARLYNEMQSNDGKKIKELAFSPYALEMFRTNADPLMYPNTDWRDYMFRDLSMQTQHNINVSGGTKRVRYFASVGYLYQNGLLKQVGDLDYDNNFKYQRYNYRTNLDIDITKTTTLKVNIGGILGVTSEPVGNSDGMWKVLNWSQPFSSPGIVGGKVMKNADIYFGNIGLKTGLDAIYGYGYIEKKKNTMNMNLEVNQKLDMITKGLSFQIKGAYNTSYTYFKQRNTSVETWTPYYKSSIDGSGLLPGSDGFDDTVMYRINGKDGNLGFSDEKTERGRDWYLEGSLRYNRSVGDHSFGALVLYNQSKTYYPKRFPEIPAAYVGLVGRITYDYRSKYMAEFNMGYNGSENFAPDKRYGFFPAGSIGWIISSEDFMQQQKVVNYLKLRVSCGLVGNDNMGDNRFLYLPDAYTLGNAGYNFGIDNPVNLKAAAEGRLGNPLVTWETALKQNYGIDAHFLKSRLKISFDYFRELRNDILIERKTIPSILDLGPATIPAVNMGEVSNRGFEAEVKWNQNFNDFQYWVSANASFARNKILFMDEIVPQYPYMAETGRSTQQQYGYIAQGFYNKEHFTDYKKGILKPGMPDPGVTVYPGDVMYRDLSGDGFITSDDITRTGYAQRPEWVFGLNYGITYKGFDLSMNWTGSANRSVMLSDEFRYPFGSTGNRSLMKFMVEERWTPDRAHIATAPRFSQTSSAHNYKNSSLWVRDASYIRLKNVKIGYTFSQKRLLKQLGISQLSLYVSGYNLLTFDSLDYMDPEAKLDKDDTYPITQIYNFGLNITF